MTVIDFTVTVAGLEDQLLGMLIRKEKVKAVETQFIKQEISVAQGVRHNSLIFDSVFFRLAAEGVGDRENDLGDRGGLISRSN